MDAAQLNDVSLSGSVAASTLRENILAELEMNPNPDWCAPTAFSFVIRNVNCFPQY